MALEEVLTTINRTLERIDGRIERSDRRGEEERRRWAERDRRWEKRDREWQRFTRETTIRNARITQEMIAAIAAIEARVNDQREQIRANTEAVLRMLDERFGPERPQG